MCARLRLMSFFIARLQSLRHYSQLATDSRIGRRKSMLNRSVVVRGILWPIKRWFFFYWIEPGVAARSRQLRPFAMRIIARHEGVKSVINLRGQNPKKKWWQREKAVCEELGIAHYEARLDSKKIATREMLLDLLSAFDCAPKPFLVKCQGGADRTSFAAALYALHCGHQLSVAQLHFNPS